MMYIIAVYLNALVIVAFFALIMHSLNFFTLLTWMMRKTIYPVRISILTATITVISAFLFNRIAIITMKTPSISPLKGLRWQWYHLHNASEHKKNAIQPNQISSVSLKSKCQLASLASHKLGLMKQTKISITWMVTIMSLVTRSHSWRGSLAHFSFYFLPDPNWNLHCK